MPVGLTVTTAGAKLIVAPAGRPVADIVTGPENPFTDARENAKLAVPPECVATLAPEAGTVRAKSVTLTVCPADAVAGRKFPSPLYDAVMASVPVGNEVTVSEATPPLNVDVPRVAPPAANVTVPLGVPVVLDRTLEVKVSPSRMARTRRTG